MTVWWCRGCGMEDTRMHTACPTCSSALETTEMEWLEDDPEREETIFEIEAPPTERAAIVQALMTEKIQHRWDNPTDLVVDDSQAEAVEKILDDIFGDDAEVTDSEGNDLDLAEMFSSGGSSGESDYEILSQLYDVVSRLQKNRDEDDIAEFLDLSGVALTAPTPFGLEDETWADVQSSVRNVSVGLGDDANAPVDSELQALRNQLHTLV
jgi:hypothetical protein